MGVYVCVHGCPVLITLIMLLLYELNMHTVVKIEYVHHKMYK